VVNGAVQWYWEGHRVRGSADESGQGTCTRVHVALSSSTMGTPTHGPACRVRQEHKGREARASPSGAPAAVLALLCLNGDCLGWADLGTGRQAGAAARAAAEAQQASAEQWYK
jgi:hypothetical protein